MMVSTVFQSLLHLGETAFYKSYLGWCQNRARAYFPCPAVFGYTPPEENGRETVYKRLGGRFLEGRENGVK